MPRVTVRMALLGALAAGCGGSEPREHAPVPRPAVEDWTIVPGVRAGAVGPSSSEADLARSYGAVNVRASPIELGEGETAPGTMIFPDDPLRRMEILWSDPLARQAPRRLVLRGERSRWMLPRDLSLGTSLTQLEERNGRPFRLAGFAWDYAGVVTSWEGGSLDSLLQGVYVYLTPRIEDRAGAAYGRVLGDRDFRSSSPDMRALDPRVYQIFVDFPAPATARTDSARQGGN